MRTQTLVIIALIAAAGTVHAQENPDSLRQNRKGPATSIAIGIGYSTLATVTPLVIYSATHRAEHIVAKLQLRRIADEAIPGDNNIGVIDVMIANAMIGVSTSTVRSVTASISGGLGYRRGERRGNLVRTDTSYSYEHTIPLTFDAGFGGGRLIKVPHTFFTYAVHDVSEIAIPFEASLTFAISRNIELTLSAFAAYGNGSFDDRGVSAHFGVGW